jgi:hypothetical protein
MASITEALSPSKGSREHSRDDVTDLGAGASPHRAAAASKLSRHVVIMNESTSRLGHVLGGIGYEIIVFVSHIPLKCSKSLVVFCNEMALELRCLYCIFLVFKEQQKHHRPMHPVPRSRWSLFTGVQTRRSPEPVSPRQTDELGGLSRSGTPVDRAR